MKRKWLAVGIILMFVGTCIIPATAQYTKKPFPASRGNWLYVGGSGPGNYSTIQEAINNSHNGDTVFVYNDSSPYYENITINKRIRLIGEDRNTTEINGRIYLSVNRIYLNEFTCKNGILRVNTSYNTVSDNIIIDCYALYITGSFNKIFNNYCENNFVGIEISHSFGNHILKNIMFRNWYGLSIDISSMNKIFHNTIDYSDMHGVMLGFSSLNIFNNNNITNNKDAGVILSGSTFNIFKRNNFINNNIYHDFYGNLFLVNSFLNHCISNYWDDWKETGPYRINGNIIFPFSSPYKYVNFDFRPAKYPYDIGE
jgi:parallel beta-helix repeat protein